MSRALRKYYVFNGSIDEEVHSFLTLEEVSEYIQDRVNDYGDESEDFTVIHGNKYLFKLEPKLIDDDR